MKKFTVFFLSLFSISFTSADDLPALGDTSDSVITKAHELEVGKSIMNRLRKSDKYLDDLEVESYLKNLGYKLVSANTNNIGAIVFFAIEDASLNAFALPGGFIGVHTGLISKVRSESELASVLAHEIAHVSQRHVARILASQKRAGVASLAALAVAILATRSSGSMSAATITAAQASAIQNRLNFSREYEHEADRIGFKIIKNSPFDVHAMESFMRFMQRTTESSSSNAPVYLRTHPFFSERLADIQNRLQKLPFKQVPDSLDFNLIKARINVQGQFSQSSIKRYSTKLEDGNYTSEIATVYGLIYSLYLAGHYERALEHISYIQELDSDNPIVLGLVASVLIKAGRVSEGLQIFEIALENFPNRLALVYGYGQALIDTGMVDKAINFLDKVILVNKKEPRLFKLQAKGYAMEENYLMQHRAQAEAYFYSGDLQLAIEQLQLAKATKLGNYFDKSSIEARLKEFKKLQVDMRDR